MKQREAAAPSGLSLPESFERASPFDDYEDVSGNWTTTTTAANVWDGTTAAVATIGGNTFETQNATPSAWNSPTTQQDRTYRVRIKYSNDINNNYSGFCICSSGTLTDGSDLTGYRLVAKTYNTSSNNIFLSRYDSGTSTWDVGARDDALTTGVYYGFDISVNSSTSVVTGRIVDEANATLDTLTNTDPGTILSSGLHAFYAQGPATAAVRYFDDLNQQAASAI